MKLNAHEHDTVTIDISPGDTDSKIKVFVHGKGTGEKTEKLHKGLHRKFTKLLALILDEC